MRDNPGAAPDGTNQKRFRLLLYGGFVIAAALAFIQPYMCMLAMLVFTIVEIVWIIVKD
ncbi:hypothetical protein [Lancefieldella sp. Marseille-Q7238]|uniref:hypothetical protein n=1 Tax=Lancefieldella sp. Marseille-Q7238 TaxID=3022127 RepID=UPI0024A89B83|nr:hypothetical protein [Lancefieldella sp. Marseille-Q7238]